MWQDRREARLLLNAVVPTVLAKTKGRTTNHAARMNLRRVIVFSLSFLLHVAFTAMWLLTYFVFYSGDVRPFIRSIFKTHELVDKARNGDRDVGSPLHYPALTTVDSSQETGEDNKGGAGAGSTASAVGGGGGTAGDKPPVQ